MKSEREEKRKKSQREKKDEGRRNNKEEEEWIKQAKGEETKNETGVAVEGRRKKNGEEQ